MAADGLASPIRQREGLDLASPLPERFGLRRHHACPPWADAVEVHFGQGTEAYVTPAGPGRVGVAFLCEAGARGGHAALLNRFPALAARLAGTPADSSAAGAGPLARRARARVLDRLVLLGDAAGYVDAISGEGISLALTGAISLAEALPRALAVGATRQALAHWEVGERRRFARYAATARLVLALARSPRLRRAALAGLAWQPRLAELLVGAAAG